MATKSILKTVHIKDAAAAKKLVRALENADRRAPAKVNISRKVTEASREDIHLMFDRR